MADRVVDASVLGALFFRERRYREARRLVGGSVLFEPTLLNYEMANIACKKAVATPRHRAFLLESLQVFLKLDIRWIDADYLQLVNLAESTDLTVYDASYLYVSRELNLPLITFDTQLARVASNWGGG